MSNLRPVNQDKFFDPLYTLDGSRRAYVKLKKLETLWINTGTLCNLTCRNCYIESSPTNDNLVYITYEEFKPYLDEIEKTGLKTREIGFTGGEPFINRHLIPMLADSLARGFDVLVLTNAMKPMHHNKQALLALKQAYGDRLTLRVSMDHYAPARHEEERGAGTWQPMLDGLKWLSDNGFRVHIAGRTVWGEDEAQLREGYRRLFKKHGLRLSAADPRQLILFPEMEEMTEVPEITTECWDILDKNPDTVMCAYSRMVIKPKGASAPTVAACTLLPYDRRFNMGQTLKEASGAVALNHSFCAKFCVLGGGSCS